MTFNVAAPRMQPDTPSPTAAVPDPCRRLSLMDHQRRAVEIARDHPRFAFFWECGLGKTVGVYAILDDERERLGRPLRTLVICSKSTMRPAWESDALHFPDLTVEVLWDANKDRRVERIKNCGADVLVTNYATFRRHAREFLDAGIRRLVVDESSAIKTHNARITLAAIDFAETMASVYLLSGTPAPNCSTEYWGQLCALSAPGIPPNFHRFARKYFTPIMRRIHGREIIERWEPSSWTYHQFLDILKSCSWALSKMDAVDLPTTTDVVREVELNPREWSAYCRAREELRVADTHIKREAVLTKCRQLAGGFAYCEGAPIEFGTSKLEELVTLLQNEIAGKAVVIWADFTFDIDRICRRLGESKVAVIDGRTKNAGAVVEAFQSGRYQYMVCQPQAAAHGLTLTRAAYAVYYSLNFSLELYQQSRDRIHRVGQGHPCVYVHILARETCDSIVYRCLREKAGRAETVKRLLRRNGRTDLPGRTET